MGKRKISIIGYKSVLKKRSLQRRMARLRNYERALCEAGQGDKIIKDVVDDLLNKVVQNFSDTCQNAFKIRSHVPLLLNLISSPAIQEDIPKGPKDNSCYVYALNLQLEENALPNRDGDICGRRIIDFPYFIKQIRKINNHSKSIHCNLNNVIFTHETRNGLHSDYYVQCTVCGYQSKISSEYPRRKNHINAEFTTGVLNLIRSVVSSKKRVVYFKVINNLLGKINLPLLNEMFFFGKEKVHRVSNSLNTATSQSLIIPYKNVDTEHKANSGNVKICGRKKQLTVSNLSNTATPQSETVLDKNVDVEHKANSMQECISSAPCKNTEDLESVLIEDQFEIKEENNASESEDDSEYILPNQTVLEENEDRLDIDKTYETLNTTIIKQEIDSDTGAEDLTSSEIMTTAKNVSNINYDKGSHKTWQQIKARTHNNTRIFNSVSRIKINKTQVNHNGNLVQFYMNGKEVIDKEIKIELDNQFEAELPTKKARTSVPKSKTAVIRNSTNKKKAVQKLHSVGDIENFPKPKFNSSKTTVSTKNFPFGANSRRIMTDQQTSLAEHTNSGSNFSATQLVNFVNKQTEIFNSEIFNNQHVYLPPMQCLPQINKVVDSQQMQHNSAIQTYQDLNTTSSIPQAFEGYHSQIDGSNTSLSSLRARHPQPFTNYYTSEVDPQFILPDVYKAQKPYNLLKTVKTEPVPSISGQMINMSKPSMSSEYSFNNSQPQYTCL